jgi:NADPH2:quinone reductase
MRAIVVDRFGPPEVLELSEVAEPQPGPGEVLVRLHAIGVNFAETERRRGLYDPPPLPWIPGKEGAGLVESAGPETDPAWLGERVAFWTSSATTRTYAEAAVVPVDALFRLPADLSFETGAALPLQGLTAYGLAHFAAPVRSGQVVLVHAAAGGVGSLLVQIARLHGARVLGTVSTPEKAAHLRDLGTEPFIYGPNLAGEVRAATDGRGVDVVYDSVGRDTQAASLAVLAPYGRLVLFGEASGPARPIEVEQLYGRCLSVGAFGLNVQVEPESWLQARRELLEWVEAGSLRLLIHEVLPLASAAAAHRCLEERRNVGKVLLRA